MELFIHPYEGENQFEKYLFRGILSGQCVAHRCGKYFIDDAYILNDNLFYLFKSVTKLGSNYQEVLNIIKNEVDFYIDFEFSVKKYRQFYNVINNYISKSKKFILMSFNQEQKNAFDSLNIPCKKIEDIECTEELSNEKIYIKPERCDHMVNLAIAKRIEMVYNTFYFPAKTTDRLTVVYGATPSLFNAIPLEQLINTSMAKKGYRLIVCDLLYDHAFYYMLDELIPIPPDPMTTLVVQNKQDEDSHYISLVMSDGDNVGFFGSKLLSLMDQRRDPEFPVTWTISCDAPNVFYKTLYQHKYGDSYIGGCGAPPDQFSKELLEQYLSYAENTLKDHNFGIKNEIEMKLINTVVKSGIKYEYPVLLYNYFNYALNRKKYDNIYTATDWIMFKCHIDKVINKKYKNGQKTILAVNINLVDMAMLCSIVRTIKEKNNNVKFVSLYETF